MRFESLKLNSVKCYYDLVVSALLTLSCSLNYVTGMKFDVEFTFNRLPVKLEHRACEKLASRRDMEDVLFPKHSCICTKEELPAEVKWV